MQSDLQMKNIISNTSYLAKFCPVVKIEYNVIL